MHTPHTTSGRHTSSSRVGEAVRIGLTLSLLVVLGLLATGCSRRPSTSTTRKEAQVRIWRVGQSEDVLRSIMSSFKSSYKTTPVKLTYTEQPLAGYELAALKSMAARQGPDIWSIPNDWIGDHTARIATLPENFFYPRDEDGVVAKTGTKPADRVKELYPSGIAEQLISTDTTSVYGLPTNVDSLRLYYNKNLLDTALQEYRKSLGNNPPAEQYTPVRQLLSSAPTTWRDLVEQTKYLTKRNGNQIERSAIALGTADNVPYSNDIVQALILQNGNRIVSTDRKNALFNVPVTTPSGVTLRPGELALDFYTSFANPSKETYTWNASMPQAIDAFGQGKVAMVIAYSDFKEQLRIKYPRFHAEVAPLPQNSVTEPPVNYITFKVESVTKTADNAEAAFAFLRTYATSTNTVASLASESETLTPFKDKLENRGNDPYAEQALTGQAVFKRSRPQFDEAFRQMILDASQNGIPSSQAIDRAAETITRLLQAPEEQ